MASPKAKPMTTAEYTLCADADTAWGITNRGWMYAFRHPGATANITYLDGHTDRNKHVFDGGDPNYVEVWSQSAPPPGGPCSGTGACCSGNLGG